METKIVSSFFANTSKNVNETETDLSDHFLYLIDKLNLALDEFKFPASVEFVYNPTIYARNTFEMYVKKYCSTIKPVMYFGMNPGPWGMSQTGFLFTRHLIVEKNGMYILQVPFGEVSYVRDWLKIYGTVNRPPQEIPSRPVKGFECTRSEQSGKRFWGLFKDLCGTPEKFFKTSFVYNYLPQQWMKRNGGNVTPGDLKASDVENLYRICDPVCAEVIELYKVQKIVAVGKFCEKRAHKIAQKYLPSKSLQILYMPHPSPRAANNNNWDQKALKFLEDSNLIKYYK